MSNITYQPIEQKYVRAVAELLRICFPLMPPEEQYNAKDLTELATVFPEGTVVALDGERIVGMGSGVFVTLDLDNMPPTEYDVLYDADGTNNHTMDGLYYYGSDMAVHPDYRRRGIGRALYEQRKAVIRRYNRKGFVAAAVLPGYEHHQDTLNIQSYVDKVVAGELFDATLSMQLRNGFQVHQVIHDFYIYPRSNNWSALIYWLNPEYQG